MAGKTKRNVATFRKSKWYSCLICNCKDESKLQNITINRHCHADSVVTFDICDDCSKQLGQDIADYYKL